MNEPVKQLDLSLAEVEARAEELVADLLPPTAEQFRALVRELLVAALAFAPDAPDVVPGWSQGYAFVKLIESQPLLRGRGVTEALRWMLARQEGADGTPGGLSPLGLFMVRMLGHKQRLAEGADPADVDIEAIIETRKFLGRVGIPLPSDECLHDLIAQQDGIRSACLWRKQSQRPKATHRRLLVGNVAHWVETLIAGEAFGAIEAAEEVEKGLKAARVLQPSGRLFKASLITKWHERVIHHAKRGEDPEWDICEMQRRVLKRLYPDHMQWDQKRLQEWLAESIRHMVRVQRPRRHEKDG